MMRENWHGSRRHDPSVRWGSRPVYQFRSRRFAKDEVLISDMETIGDWTMTQGDSIAVDAVNFKEGNQGIRWRSINFVYCTVERTIALNCFGQSFELWGHIDNIDNISYMCFEFEAAAPWAKYFRITVGFLPLFNGWNKFSLSRADATYEGGAVHADWATISKVRLRIRALALTTLNVTFDDFRMIRNRFAGKVTLRFDDAHEDHYDEARARMDEYGYRGVIASPTVAFGTAGNMSLANAIHLNERGWDIVHHGVTHVNLTTLTPAELERELWNSQRWLTEQGFYRGSRFCIPTYGAVNPAVLERIDKYYIACNHRSGDYNPIPPVRYPSTRDEVDVALPLATVQGYVDKAVEDQAWLILLFHSIAGFTAKFQDIIDYIYASGLEVVTFSDVYDELIGREEYTQLLEFGVQGAITPNATSYPCPGGGVAAQTANEIKIPISIPDGWLRNLRVKQRVASGGGGWTDIYTARLNGADTLLTCTLDNATEGNDLVNPIRVGQGDEISVKLVSNNVGDTTEDVSVTMELERLR